LSEYIYHNDFQLGNKTLSSFNGIIINTDDSKKKMNLLPEIEHIVDKDSFNNGERYIRSRYQPRVIDIDVMFSDDVDLDELSAWLGHNKQQTFSWCDDIIDKEISVIYQKGFDLDVYYGKKFYGQTNLSFIAHYPFWKVKKEKDKIITNPNINQEYTFKSKGNIESLPIIKITPIGTQSNIIFKWNDLTVALTNIDKPIYIDSEGQVYEMINGIKVYQMIKYFSNLNYDMPTVQPFVRNKFILVQGAVSEVKITLNSEIL